MEVGVLVLLLLIYAILFVTTVLTLCCVHLENQKRRRHAFSQTDFPTQVIVIQPDEVIECGQTESL